MHCLPNFCLYIVVFVAAVFLFLYVIVALIPLGIDVNCSKISSFQLNFHNEFLPISENYKEFQRKLFAGKLSILLGLIGEIYVETKSLKSFNTQLEILENSKTLIQILEQSNISLKQKV